MRTKKIFKTIILSFSLFVAGCDPMEFEEIIVPEQNLVPFDAKLSIDLSKKRPVNRNILGNNIQWVDRGDGLIEQGSLNFSPQIAAKTKQLGISVLRYPGGSLSDLYHWKDGMGAMNKRKRNKRFGAAGDDQVVLGTKEFLTLSKSLNAEPLITVNVASGTAQEAAAWVRLTNITGVQDAQGNPLPKVKYWEIGNEPYLIEDKEKDLAMTPEEFAERANAFIKEMKMVDPSIIVGIPLRSDTLGSAPATPMPGFNDKVLKAMRQPFEYVALHNAYFPFAYDNVTNPKSLYLSAMSARKFVKDDIDRTLGQLKKYFPKKKFKIAITEYNAMFTLGQGDSDGLISSLVGALYVADVLTLFAEMEEVWMANYWSLAGNWHFGAIREDGEARPSFFVLEAFNRLLRGQVVSTQINTPTFKNVKVGAIPAVNATPCISSIVTLDKGKLTVLIVNKHINQKAQTAFDVPGVKIKSMKVQTLTAKNFQSDKVSQQGWSSFQPVPADQPVMVAPHSLAIVEMEIG